MLRNKNRVQYNNFLMLETTKVSWVLWKIRHFRMDWLKIGIIRVKQLITTDRLDFRQDPKILTIRRWPQIIKLCNKLSNM